MKNWLPIAQKDKPDTTSLAFAFALGAVCGGALMFILDPEAGRRRRALAQDQVTHARHQFGELGEDARGRAQDLRNRATGTVHEARSTAAGFSSNS